MNVKARINARKITLNFFYEILFMKLSSTKEQMFDKIFKEDKAITRHESNQEERDNIKTIIKDYYKISEFEAEVHYVINNFFKKEKSEWIDLDYINKVVPLFDEYYERINNLINNVSDSFKFEEMDLIDRAIFLLWYIEYDVIKTPKKVILNEMVELAKRYWDDWSFKLINWIWHKILEDRAWE